MSYFKIGDFVSAKLQGVDDCRQGVVIQVFENGTFVIRGEIEDYACEGPATVVPDKNLIFTSTRLHVQKVRKMLAEAGLLENKNG